MQAAFDDGTTKTRRNMTDKELAEELVGLAREAGSLACVEVWRETGKEEVNPYGDNRQGRRRWAREQRRRKA